jgi:hypothetical protein
MFFKKRNEKLEDAFYEKIANEIRNGEVNQGLWLKATVESGGSEFHAKALYVKLRVKQLERELVESQEYEARKQIELDAIKAQRKAMGMVTCPKCKSEVISQLIYVFMCPKCGYTGQ